MVAEEGGRLESMTANVTGILARDFRSTTGGMVEKRDVVGIDLRACIYDVYISCINTYQLEKVENVGKSEQRSFEETGLDELY